jgi:hypothetical protein
MEKITERKEWQGYIKNADQEIETVDLVSTTYRPDIDMADFVRQAPPVRITPSRAKKLPRKDIETRFISIPDSQIGYRDTPNGLVTLHDERAIAIARQAIIALQPDVLVLQGDTIDLPELTRFDPDSTDFTPRTLQMGIDRTARYKGELRADIPNSDQYELEGNHEYRLGRFVLKHAMMLHGIRRGDTQELPVLSYDYLTRCDDTKTNFISGYPANGYQPYDDLLFVHGKDIASNGSTAEKYSKKYPDTNVVFGHIHRHELHTRTTRGGKYLTSASFGTLASTDGSVPSYNSAKDSLGNVVKYHENWQQGFGVIDRYKNGNYSFRFIPIIGGIALNAN